MRSVGWLIGISMLSWIVWGGGAVNASNPVVLAQEARIWDLALKAQIEQERTVTLWRHRELEAFVQLVVDDLWSHAVTDLPPARLRLVQEAVAAAHAYPNGVIYLTTGMITQARNTDQLAMIIAHEMVHYNQRHALQAFIALQKPFPGGIDSIDHPFSIHGFADSNKLTAMHARFEHQADSQGLALMLAAGYRTAEVLPLLRAFLEKSASGPGSAECVEAESLQGRLERVQVLIEHMSEHAPGVPDDPISPVAEHAYRVSTAPALLANARSAIQQGLWTLGAENVLRYLAIIPHDPLAHYYQGETQRRIGLDAEQALLAYHRAIGLDDTFAPAYRAIGVIHFKAGRLARARHYFETSLVMGPNDTESEYIRGYIQLCRD